jgi:carbon monoxide dehydrogenase subunit G
MDLNHEFTVHRPIEEAWKILTDVERIAPCLPGAELQEIEGDVYRGQVKVKVGPILAKFKGEAHFVERDDASHKAVLQAHGRDTTGKGNAEALITAQLEPVSDDVTTCKVLTHLSITGKVAQFGRGALADVSDKLLAQFSHNLNDLIDQQGGVAAPAGPAPEAAATEAPPAEAPVEQAAPAAPTVRKIEGPAAEPLDLGQVAGGAIAKRLVPVLVGLVIVLLVWRRRRRR